jgi:preprotein translocase subunit SecD
MFAKFGFALFCISLLFVSVGRAVTGAERTNSQLSIRIIDDGVDGNARKGPPGEDRFPNSTRGIGLPGFLWLKRDGAITGDLISETHGAVGADGQPVVDFTFTPAARDKFTALPRAILGHRLAFVLNGTIITQALINGVMD